MLNAKLSVYGALLVLMVISYNTKLSFPNRETEARYKEVLEAEKDCYNYLSDIFDKIDFRHHRLSRYDVHYKYYKELRNKFSLLSSQMILKVILETVSCWNASIEINNDRFSTPVKKNLSMLLDKRLYSKLTNQSVDLTVTGFSKRVQCSFQSYSHLQKLFDLYKPQNCSIFYKNEQFWLTIQFDVPETEHIEGDALGIDRGIRRIVTCSDGTGWINREFNRERRKLRYLRRCLKSKNTKSAKRHLKKLSKTERNRSKNEVHRVVNWLLSKDYTTYVLEDLSKIKQSTSKKTIKVDGQKKEIKRKKHNNRFGQIPLKEIQTTLEYKAPLLGKEVVTVEPAYTSQLDYRALPKGMRLGTRYCASDGELLDADGNAACNIVLRHRPDSIVVKPTYGSMVFSGRPQSTGQSWLRLVQNVAATSSRPFGRA